MKLELEIKQAKFESEQQKAMLNILVTSNWISSQQSKFLKHYDLTPPQYNVLRILRGAKNKPMMLSDISSRMLDKMSNATRLVEKLRNKDLLVRELCDNNRRQVDISITELGLSLLAEIDTAFLDSKINAVNLSNKEAEKLNELLEKIRQ